MSLLHICSTLSWMSRRDERSLNRAISDEDSNDYGCIANRRPPIPSLGHHWPAGYQSFVAGYSRTGRFVGRLAGAFRFGGIQAFGRLLSVFTEVARCCWRPQHFRRLPSSAS